MIDEPTSFLAVERKRQFNYANLYVISNLDNGDVVLLTGMDGSITVSGTLALPTGNSINNPTFVKSTASHSNMKLDSETSNNGISFSVWAKVPSIQRYFVVPGTNRITIDIYRCNNVATPQTIGLAHIFHGDLQQTGFAGELFTAQFVPASMAFDKPIPRYFYQRRCNHVFGGVGCYVDLSAYTTYATITGFNRYSRLVQATIENGWDAGFFQNGFLLESSTDTEVGIVTAQNGNAPTDPKSFFVMAWVPELENVGAQLSITQGCAHTQGDCNRFGNIDNWGGMSTIPVQNPAYDGVQ